MSHSRRLQPDGVGGRLSLSQVTSWDIGANTKQGLTAYLGCVPPDYTHTGMATEGCFSGAPTMCAGTAAEGRMVWHNTLDPLHSNVVLANNRTAEALADPPMMQ